MFIVQINVKWPLLWRCFFSRCWRVVELSQGPESATSARNCCPRSGQGVRWRQDELGGELGHVWKLLKAGRQSGSRARDFNIKLQTVQWQRRWGRRTSRRQQFRFENVHTGWNDTKTSITCRVSRLVIVDEAGFWSVCFLQQCAQKCRRTDENGTVHCAVFLEHWIHIFGRVFFIFWQIS